MSSVLILEISIYVSYILYETRHFQDIQVYFRDEHFKKKMAKLYSKTRFLLKLK
jgi:hypothetical protein